jgi:uncharacterized protein YndB with AHSA1/START domain
MTDTAVNSATREIVVDEIFPHSPETIWKALTDGGLIRRWMPMEPTGFEAVEGNRFTFHTTPGGAWDGTIHCEVLEVVPAERFAFAWKGGDESNVGYGAPLDTVVTVTLSEAPGGTRVRLVHSGFVLPKNETAFTGMSQGWPKVVQTIGDVAGAKAE